jgi:hypothetical protein
LNRISRANGIVFVPTEVVGAVGIPVNAGATENTADPVPVSSDKEVDRSKELKLEGFVP